MNPDDYDKLVDEFAAELELIVDKTRDYAQSTLTALNMIPSKPAKINLLFTFILYKKCVDSIMSKVKEGADDEMLRVVNGMVDDIGVASGIMETKVDKEKFDEFKKGFGKVVK